MNRLVSRWLLLIIVVMAFSIASFSQVAVGISVRIGPPALPVYAQPICPGPGYLWTPGYWAWSDDDGYYWVPGTWVVAPVGMYWTPGWWGWGGGLYVWHPGYWGPHVGFYGGIVYGYGYTGVGFVGGEWRGGGFYYNRSVTNVSVTNVTNVYNRTVVVNNTNVNNVSYNGGSGGIQARPTAQEETYAHEQHTPAVAAQTQHEHAAMQNRDNFAAVNHGRPAIAATARPADFSRHSAVPARAAGGEYHAPAISPKEARVASNSHVASNAGAKGRNNDGFRPFTPPSKGGSPNAPAHGGNMRPDDHSGNSTARGDYRPAQGRTNQSRPYEGRPQNQPREMSRPNPPRENGRESMGRPSEPPRREAPAPREERRR